MSVHVWVTGFGPFPGCEVNPTDHLVKALKKEINSIDQTKGRNDDLASGYSIKGCFVFETSASGSKAKLETIFKLARDTAIEAKRSGKESLPISVLFLHLGVHIEAKVQKLESSAYNEASFRVPDEQGLQLSKARILKQNDFGHSLTTSIPVKDICHALVEDGYHCMVSADPGRYICNWVYYLSLSETRLQPLQHSLFLHIPNFSEIKEETQMKFLEDMIAKICAHIIEKSNESNIQSG
mmetsp:Transcript_1755/g.2487  ORF Transcript_1755/g.2487 Transcript_1755/m.2487 type:complete len:239 (+) Transcript_1755:2275-2991(+)